MRIFRRHVEPAWQDTVIRWKRRVDRAEAEIALLRAGEDPTPVEEGAMPTPGQWVYRWNRTVAAERLARLQAVYEDYAAARRCLEGDHVAELKFAEQDRARLDGQVERARDLGAKWAALAPPGEWADNLMDTLTSDHGRAILAALDEEPAPGGAHA